MKQSSKCNLSLFSKSFFSSLGASSEFYIMLHVLIGLEKNIKQRKTLKQLSDQSCGLSIFQKHPIEFLMICLLQTCNIYFKLKELS